MLCANTFRSIHSSDFVLAANSMAALPSSTSAQPLFAIGTLDFRSRIADTEIRGIDCRGRANRTHPAAALPATSHSRSSPTNAHLSFGTPNRWQAAWKICLDGLRQPTSPQRTMTSTRCADPNRRSSLRHNCGGLPQGEVGRSGRAVTLRPQPFQGGMRVPHATVQPGESAPESIREGCHQGQPLRFPGSRSPASRSSQWSEPKMSCFPVARRQYRCIATSSASDLQARRLKLARVRLLRAREIESSLARRSTPPACTEDRRGLRVIPSPQRFISGATTPRTSCAFPT